MPPIPVSPRADGTDDVSFNHTTPDSDAKATEAATEEKEANHDENSTHNSEPVQNGDTSFVVLAKKNTHKRNENDSTRVNKNN